MSTPKERYTKPVQLMTYDEGFILRPEDAKERIEKLGFIIVLIKNEKGKPFLLARPEDIKKIQEAILGRYHLLDEHRAEY